MASVGNKWNLFVLSLFTTVVVFWFPVLGYAIPQQETGVEHIQPLHLLIEKLADENFDTRQDAESRLLERGATVLPHLEIQRQATDQELRLRVNRIIEMIRLQEMERAVKAFLMGEGSLPGWETYSTGTGDDDIQREAFVKLYRQRKETLDRHQNDQDQIGLLKELLKEFSGSGAQQVIFQDGLMTCLSMQIIKTLPKVDSQDELPQIRKTLSRYFQQTAFAKMVSDRNRLKNLHRQAAILWVQFPDPLIAEMTLRMAVAQALGIREGLVVALEYLRRPDTGQSTSIRNALTLVADYGDESHIPLLERHLDNALLLHPRFVSENREQTSVYQVQVKDLVLSTMVHLAGLKYQNFGLNLRDISFQGQPLPIPQSGFLNSEDREAANKKWRTFRQTGNSKTSH